MSSTGRNSDAKTIEVLRGLRQARRFTAEDVPQEAIDDILEVARWTGSGNNRQPWDLVLVRDHDTLKRIAEQEASNAHIAGANFVIIVVNTPDNGIINAYDEGRLTERMMLAAEAHGVASGIWWFKDGGAAAKSILGIPEDRTVRTALSFGYEDKQASPAASRSTKGRRPISDLVHTEKF